MRQLNKTHRQLVNMIEAGTTVKEQLALAEDVRQEVGVVNASKRAEKGHTKPDRSEATAAGPREGAAETRANLTGTDRGFTTAGTGSTTAVGHKRMRVGRQRGRVTTGDG